MSVGNQLVSKANQKVGITAYLTNDSIKNYISSVIGKDTSKFVTAIVSAVNANPALQECTNQSILSAALLGQSLNLSPSPTMAFYYLVPYADKEKGKVATFQMGYRGLIQLATRTGIYKKLNVVEIKEGELIKFDALNEEIEVNLIEDEAQREKTPTIGYYAVFEYVNGFRKAMYWSKAKMIAHADRYSKAFSKDTYKKIQEGKIPASDMWKYSSPWYSSFDTMACKTMIRQLISKWGLMSSEFETAYAADMAVINEDLTPTYVDTEDVPAEAPKMPDKPVEPEKPTESTPKKVKPENKADNDIANALFGGNT